MLIKHYIVHFLLLIILLSEVTYGQSVVQLAPYSGPSTELVAQIIADTTAHGIVPDRVYELQGGQIYLCQQTYSFRSPYVLRFRSSNSDKPRIYLYPTGTGTNPQRPPGYFIRLYSGASLEMSGIAIAGYFEPIDTNFNNVQGGIFRNDDQGSNYTFDNCVFSNIAGQIVRCEGATGTIRVTNCIFTNLGALSTSNFGAGKGLDLRAVSVDTLILVNNTFTNYQDRVVRHYNVTAGNPYTANLNYTRIDHNTIFNGMGFHGVINLGNVGSKVIITNNLFKDAFAAGEDSTDNTRAIEWSNTGELYPNGNNRMMWIFTAPNDTTQWAVSNNFYAVSDSGQKFFDEHTAEPILVGSPLSWHINHRLGADSVTAFTQITDPGLVHTQNLMMNLMRWYVSPTGGNKTKNTPSSLWSWPEDDMDRQPLSFWINDLDASYSTSSPAYSGSQGSFPAGDLNWFPSKKAEWETWITDVKLVNENIPESFTLSQNYPNPFNPSTRISFTLVEPGITTLAIYNLLGEKIATLVNKELNTGNYSFDFNASNLSSGVYFYRLESGKYSAVHKMMLLK